MDNTLQEALKAGLRFLKDDLGEIQGYHPSSLHIEFEEKARAALAAPVACMLCGTMIHPNHRVDVCGSCTSTLAR